MTDTNKLTPVTNADLASSDLLRLWSQKFGGNARMTLAVLKEWLQSNLTFTGEFVEQYEAPTATGFSVTVAVGGTWLILTPSAGYAAGTIVLPAGSAGAEVLVNSTQAVTALTVTPATGETQLGAPAALAANDFFRMKYDAIVKRWYRVG